MYFTVHQDSTLMMGLSTLGNTNSNVLCLAVSRDICVILMTDERQDTLCYAL